MTGESLAMAREIVLAGGGCTCFVAQCREYSDRDRICAAHVNIALAITRAVSLATRQERERAAGKVCGLCRLGYEFRDGRHPAIEERLPNWKPCHAAAILAADTPAEKITEPEEGRDAG